MTRGPLQVLLLAAASLAIACEGHQVSVFEFPAMAVAGAGAPGTAGSLSDAGGGGQGATSGSSSGGSFNEGGAPVTSGGSSGQENTAGMSGADGSGRPPPCGASSDCMPGWLCEKQGCDAPTGVCIPWPVFCPPNPAPVCGCDGVTYWNDCIRLQSRARLQGFDQCRATACTCDIGADCGVPYASCSHLLSPGDMCGRGVGACWVLPPKCQPSADSKMWRECKPPEPGQPPTCLDTCQAIASEHTFAELHRNEVCD